MTKVQQRFVELERQKAQYKQYLEALAEANQAVCDEIGVGGMFQDDKDVVYKMVIPTGKFVHYEAISYLRTRREGETRAPYPLAEKEAREAGFAL